MEELHVPTCRNCIKTGKRVALISSTHSELPDAAGCVGVVLILVGVLGLFVGGLGLIAILAGILVLSLGRVTKPALRCPECAGIRIIG